MSDPTTYPEIGVILLSDDYHIVGANAQGLSSFGANAPKLGDSIFAAHPQRSREKVREVLDQLTSGGPSQANTLILDVLDRVLLYDVSRVQFFTGDVEAAWAVTLVDLTEATGAEKNPLTGLLQLKRLPIFDGLGYRYLQPDDVYSIVAEGDYCEVSGQEDMHTVRMSLREIIERFAAAGFFRVHRGCVVNLKHVAELAQRADGTNVVVLDDPARNTFPVSRRRLKDLREALERT